MRQPKLTHKKYSSIVAKQTYSYPNRYAEVSMYFYQNKNTHLLVQIFSLFGNIIIPQKNKLSTFFVNIHPSAISSTIITENPIAKNSVPTSEFSASEISGTSSSTTTYIIAPAAKASIYGSVPTIIS